VSRKISRPPKSWPLSLRALAADSRLSNWMCAKPLALPVSLSKAVHHNDAHVRHSRRGPKGLLYKYLSGVEDEMPQCRSVLDMLCECMMGCQTKPAEDATARGRAELWLYLRWGVLKFDWHHIIIIINMLRLTRHRQAATAGNTDSMCNDTLCTLSAMGATKEATSHCQLSFLQKDRNSQQQGMPSTQR